MEDNRKVRECKVQRCYECSRLQDELWDMAYEQVWPLVRRALAGQPAEQKCAPHEERHTQGVPCHGGQTQRRALCARELAAAG
jgi:hypothetical protein